MAKWPQYKANGDSAVLIEFENIISEDINDSVQQMALAIDRQKLDYIIEIVPTYRSLCVYYNALIIKYNDIVTVLQNIYQQIDKYDTVPTMLIEIPVCYDKVYAPDLDHVAKVNHLTRQEVIDIHSAPNYRIYMLGFSAGFPYLGGLDARIATPRLSEPRTSVAAGSVGIAAEQTGIYPEKSPAGWQIIGRTPLKLYDVTRTEPILLKAGDYLHFYPINGQQFNEIAANRAAYKLIKKSYQRGAL